MNDSNIMVHQAAVQSSNITKLNLELGFHKDWWGRDPSVLKAAIANVPVDTLDRLISPSSRQRYSFFPDSAEALQLARTFCTTNNKGAELWPVCGLPSKKWPSWEEEPDR